VVVEDDQHRTGRLQVIAQGGKQRLAAGAPPQRQHLQQRPVVPVADPQPGDPAREPGAKPVRQRRRQHRLAAATAADQRQAVHASGGQCGRQGPQLGAPPLEVDGRGQALVDEPARGGHASVYTLAAG
jgi:hypothetical protein